MVFKLLAIIAFLGSVAWMIHSPDYEPAMACVTSLSACIAAFVAERRKIPANQSQEVSGGSVAVQAGRDASVRNVHSSDKDSNA